MPTFSYEPWSWSCKAPHERTRSLALWGFGHCFHSAYPRILRTLPSIGFRMRSRRGSSSSCLQPEVLLSARCSRSGSRCFLVISGHRTFLSLAQQKGMRRKGTCKVKRFGGDRNSDEAGPSSKQCIGWSPTGATPCNRKAREGDLCIRCAGDKARWEQDQPPNNQLRASKRIGGHTLPTQTYEGNSMNKSNRSIVITTHAAGAIVLRGAHVLPADRLAGGAAGAAGGQSGPTRGSSVSGAALAPPYRWRHPRTLVHTRNVSSCPQGCVTGRENENEPFLNSPAHSTFFGWNAAKGSPVGAVIFTETASASQKSPT